METLQPANGVTIAPNTPIYEIAEIIRKDWRNINFAARPYLDAMYCINTIHDQYGSDSGRSIVLYFLCNAGTWRGETAKAVKKYLNKLTKG